MLRRTVPASRFILTASRAASSKAASMKTPSSIEPSSILVINKGPQIPPLKLKWYYATTNPLRYPVEYGTFDRPKETSKFQAFQDQDCYQLEKKYRELIDSGRQVKDRKDANEEIETSGKFKVEVNDDHLFEVDLESMEMKPIYWSGAVYEIRRGTWFSNDGNPLSRELSEELEKGYEKCRPFEKTPAGKEAETSNPLKKLEIITEDKSDLYELQGKFKEADRVIYGKDNESAYFVDKSYGSLQITNMLKTLELSTGLDSIRVVRGFKETKTTSTEDSTPSSPTDLSAMFEIQLTQLFGTGIFGESEKENNDQMAQKAMELEISNDYNSENDKTNSGNKIESKKRKINHLVLCIHGIGQMLGVKFQTANFIHTVNILRNNIKKANSENVRKEENKEKQGSNQKVNDDDIENSGIQVLPIVWRHKIDFKAGTHLTKRLPSLLDITVDNIKPMRNLIGAVFFDILLYYEPHYLKQILDEVTKQANFIYKEFRLRNPDFDGKVSIIGHSLGSVIGFDILSSQYPDVKGTLHNEDIDALQLDFPVENYFSLGSPVGVFNLLKRKSIASRTDDVSQIPAHFVSQPKCVTLFNVFHPCDPVAYKIEPLVDSSLKQLKPATLEVDSVVNTLNKKWSSITDSLGNLNWDFPTAAPWDKLMPGIAEGVLNLVKSDEKQDVTKNAGEKKKSSEKEKKKITSFNLTDEQLNKLTSLNYKGRVDYALEQGLLDWSVLSAISAHISYFESEAIAAFVLKETLVENKERVTKMKVSVSDGE